MSGVIVIIIIVIVTFLLGIYAMIDLYGQCVQISVYDEDYQGAPVIELSEEQEAVAESTATTNGTSMQRQIRIKTFCWL